MTRYLTPSNVEQANVVLRWAREYISQPNADLGRDGLVCPFVPFSLNRDEFLMAFHDNVGDDEEVVVSIVLDHAAEFAARRSGSTSPMQYLSIVAVFPDLPEPAEVLDRVHVRLKSRLVNDGLMLGQFHSTCTEPSIRNPAFKVSISPLPIIVIRKMSVHDILFLHERDDWFTAYSTLYAGEYASGRVRSPDLVRLFENTKARLQGKRHERGLL